MTCDVLANVYENPNPSLTEIITRIRDDFDDAELVDAFVLQLNVCGGRYHAQQDPDTLVVVALTDGAAIDVGEPVGEPLAHPEHAPLVPGEPLVEGKKVTIPATAPYTIACAGEARLLFLAFRAETAKDVARPDPLRHFTGTVHDTRFFTRIAPYYTDEDGREYTHCILKPRFHLEYGGGLLRTDEMLARFPGNSWLSRWEHYMIHNPECCKVLLLRRKPGIPNSSSKT